MAWLHVVEITVNAALIYFIPDIKLHAESVNSTHQLKQTGGCIGDAPTASQTKLH
jgi:hypothetical protein